MGEALKASATKVQRKVYNLCKQVRNYFPNCSLYIIWMYCNGTVFVWNGQLICKLHYIHECATCLAKHVWRRWCTVPWVSFVFPFFCVNWIKCCKVSNAALCGTCIWQLKRIFLNSSLHEKVKWPKVKHVVVPRGPQVGWTAQSMAQDGRQRKSSAPAVFPWRQREIVWRNGNDAAADDCCEFVWNKHQEMSNGIE